jgi:hypothetical protein
MSDFDDIIRAARDGFEPRVGDRERVWTSLVARMGGAGVAVALVAKTSGAATTSSALAGQSLGALAKLFFASVAVTLAGSGAIVGVTRFMSSAGEQPFVAPALAPSTTARAVESTPEASSARAVSTPPPPPDSTAVDPVARPQGAVAAVEPEVPDRQELARELTLLREVRRASEMGDHARAQHVLDRLDEQHPRGALMEERAALRAVTACEAGATSRAPRARDFLRRYPASVYAAKVERVCGTDSKRPPRESSTKSFTDLVDAGH